jgi:hypothetical protein
MQAKIIQFSDYVGRGKELKNNEDKIKAALDRIANNLKVLEKYGIKKNN